MISIKIGRNTSIKPYWIISAILFVALFNGVFRDELGVPGLFVHINDVFMLLLVFLYFRENATFRYTKTLKPIIIWLAIYFFYTLIGYILNYDSMFYYLNGLRNNFRFFLFFLLCIHFLKNVNIKNYILFLNAVYYINAIVMLYQYFVLGLSQDYLGGIFGTAQGCNGPLNVFFVIIVSKEIIFYINKKTGLKSLILICGSSLLLSSVSELKFFFIEFVIMVIYAMIRTKFSWKKILIVVGSIIGLYAGIQILNNVFSGWEDFFSIERILNATTQGGYSARQSIYQVNRLTFIAVINRLYLHTPISRLVGLGIGNCDFSSFSKFHTSFFDANYRISSYTWMMSSHTYLEQGLLGLILYLTFYIIVFVLIYKQGKNDNASKVLCQWCELMTIVSFLIVFYNQSMREEIALLTYFVLALPFVFTRREL